MKNEDMKRIVYCVMIVLAGCLTSCLNDQTTGPHIDVSDIAIEKTDTVLYPMLGEEFVFDPSKWISQTYDKYELSYQWRMGKIVVDDTEMLIQDSLKMISNDVVFKYTFTDLDAYHLRLKVSNEFGSTYQYFLVKPVSKFDEGIIMLSRNDGGQAMLSMVNTNTDELELWKKETSDFWFVTSEDMPLLNDDIVDLALIAGRGDYNVNRNNYLYLLSRKNSTAYYLDHRTMDVINDSYKFSKVPLKLGLFFHKTGTYGSGFDLFPFCEDGDVLAFCFLFGIEIDRTALRDMHHWDRCHRIKMRSADRMAWTLLDVLLLFDDENSSLSGLMNQDIATVDKVIGPRVFPGEKVVNVGYLEENVGKYDFYVVLQNLKNPRKITVQKFAGYGYKENFLERAPGVNYSYELPEGEELSLVPETEVFNCFQHRNIVWHNKYQVFSWTPGGSVEPRLPSVNGEEAFDVRSVNPHAEITCITADVSNNYVLIGVYDPTASNERKGSVYVLDAFDFSVIKKFENIAWKPVELYYKPNVMRSYGSIYE